MNLGSLVRAALLAPVLAALAGCASPSNCCGDPGTAGTVPSSVAERLAVALADAGRAFARADQARLTDALRRIDGLGGRPVDGTPPEMVQWRQAVAYDPPMRGRPLGPGYRSGQLGPGGSEQIEQLFLSGERASIALSSPTEVELTLSVVNRREESVCGRRGNPSQCNWVPLFTERYRITVTNQTERGAHYFLVVE